MNYSCCHQPADSRSEAHVWCNKRRAGRRKKLGQTVSSAACTLGLKAFISIPNVFHLRREESRDHWGTIEQQSLILSNVMDLIGCRKTQTRQKCHKKKNWKNVSCCQTTFYSQEINFHEGFVFSISVSNEWDTQKKKRPWERDRLW